MLCRSRRIASAEWESACLRGQMDLQQMRMQARSPWSRMPRRALLFQMFEACAPRPLRNGQYEIGALLGGRNAAPFALGEFGDVLLLRGGAYQNANLFSGEIVDGFHGHKCRLWAG